MAVHDDTIRSCGRWHARWDGWAELLARVPIVLSISHGKYETAEVDAWSNCRRADVAAGVCKRFVRSRERTRDKDGVKRSLEFV